MGRTRPQGIGHNGFTHVYSSGFSAGESSWSRVPSSLALYCNVAITPCLYPGHITIGPQERTRNRWQFSHENKHKTEDESSERVKPRPRPSSIASASTRRVSELNAPILRVRIALSLCRSTTTERHPTAAGLPALPSSQHYLHIRTSNLVYLHPTSCCSASFCVSSEPLLP